MPTKRQIEALAKKLGRALGGDVHLLGGDLAATVDQAYPDMTDEEYAAIRITCIRVADRLRRSAFARIWGDKS